MAKYNIQDFLGQVSSFYTDIKFAEKSSQPSLKEMNIPTTEIIFTKRFLKAKCNYYTNKQNMNFGFGKKKISTADNFMMKK